MLLLERDSQLQGLDSALSQVKAGAGCVALVYGEAGIGKTSLVEYFLKDKGKAWRMLRGACDSLFTPRPLGPLHDIALETQGRLLSLLDSEGNRTAIFSACLTELKSQSTILVIEDIHWADEATLDLLKYLGRRIGQTPSLMILTYRDDEIGIDHPLRLLVGDLGSQNTLHRISVSALSRQAVQELAKDKKVDTAELHRLTNGNPFFVTEALPAGSGVPETVRDAVLARAARLSAPARNLLEAAAVIGLRMEPWLLSKISEEEAGRIEECISRGMLQLQGNYYAFRHELARQTILEAISPQRRIALHRKILNALKESPDVHYDLARLANHAEGTGDANAVLEYAPAAARHASAAAAHREAAALYELALRFADVLPPLQRIQMLEAYAGEEWFLHRSERLIALCRDIIEKYHVLGDGLREGGNLALLAVELHSLGRTAEEQEAIQAAIGILEQLPPGAELARAYGVHGFLLAEKLDYLGGIAASEKAIALAERFRDFDTLARACTNVGSSMLSMGDERGRAPMERALAVAREHDLHYAASLTFANWAVALVQTFQFEEAGDLLQEGVDYATGHDVDYLLVGLLHLRAQIQVYQGNWMEAAGLLRETRRPPDIEIPQQVFSIYLSGRLGARQGATAAQRTLDEALALSIQANSLDPINEIRAARAEAAWLAGNHRRALDEVRAAYDLTASQRAPWIMGELAFWRWRAGDIFDPPEWIAKPYALQIAGDWRGAAKEWEIRGCPYEQAMALMDGDEAAQLAALRIFESLGARPITEKLKQKMRAEGIRGIPRGPRPATRENRFGLTAREMEVLACLVKGSSNNAIAGELSLSGRTVEHHIASMLQKTGAQSRNELVALASKEGPLPAE